CRRTELSGCPDPLAAGRTALMPQAPAMCDGRAHMPARRKEVAEMAAWRTFRTCPGCSYNFATGDGEHSCSYGECAYLPEELDVFCESCRFNYLTMEGNPKCEDPMTCEHAPV